MLCHQQKDVYRSKPKVSAILAAEMDSEDAKHLLRCLKILSPRVLLATTAEEIMRLMRQQILERAVGGIELVLHDEPILARLSRLPALEYLVATGPGGDPQTEILARSTGAKVYLPRPVNVRDLAAALCLPTPGMPQPVPMTRAAPAFE
jgi:ActR/RegA family two-component response regulator